ncbi:MAG TPA: hypothetical protein PLI90_12970 [Rhodocyclaceae bacterium]|nr:hypothetical protein [Rhodocyclaceae bacterium]
MRQQYHRQPEATSIGKMSIAHVDTWVNVPERPLAKVCYGSNGHN